MKINTVNVVEICGKPANIFVRSWSDDPEGNKEAEQSFRECILDQENPVDELDILDAIEDGIYEEGDYTLLLTHSVHA